MKRSLIGVAVVILLITCPVSAWNNTVRGGAIGAAGGAIGGAIAGNAGKGAAIGAAVGGFLGLMEDLGGGSHSYESRAYYYQPSPPIVYEAPPTYYPPQVIYRQPPIVIYRRPPVVVYRGGCRHGRHGW